MDASEVYATALENGFIVTLSDGADLVIGGDGPDDIRAIIVENEITLKEYLFETGIVEPPNDAALKPSKHFITITNNLQKDAYAAWEAIHKLNEPPLLFRHGGTPARVERDDSNSPIIRPVNVDAMRFVLARAADWTRPKRVGKEWIACDCEPPLSIVRDILATPDMPLPILTRVVQAPIFAPSGALQTEPGYQDECRVFYDRQIGLKMPTVADEPLPADILKAVEFVNHDLLGDFPFVNDAEKATATALFLLPFCRELIDGPTPLHLFEKPSAGTGATLLVDMLTYPSTGRPIATMSEGNDEDEWRKRITAKLMTGPTHILIDNLRRRLDSAAVSSAITAPSWEDRILGQSTIASLPIGCAWIATGNNPAVSSEIARRTVRCRLDARIDRPWLRKGFKHDDLRGWAKENRGNLIWAALTIIRGWLVVGRPMAENKLGMFESWSAVMGGILRNAGIRGFLDNLTEFYDASDTEGEQWRALLVEWWESHGNSPVGVADLFTLSDQCNMTVWGNSERAQKIRFGKMLSQQRDRTFNVETESGMLSLAVTDAGKVKRAQQWSLKLVNV